MARIRTFIAVGLDPALRDHCAALQEKLGRSAAKVKWVERDNIHVTLLFLGEVDDRDLPAICKAVAGVAKDHAPFGLSLQGIGAFPDADRPRIVWAGVGDGRAELAALHDALEPPLLDLGCYRREERAYTPHVTLGRVQGERDAAPLAQALSGFSNWQGGVMDVAAIHVMASELTRDGPMYTVLSTVRLG